MKITKFAAASVVALAALTTAVPASATSPPVADDIFTFDGSLTESNGSTVVTPYGSTCTGSGPCNTASGYGTSAGDGYWEWTSTDDQYGGGFTYNPSVDIGDSYTIFLKFQINTPSTGDSYNKIIDYQNLNSDNGFYLYEDGEWVFTFYPLDDGVTGYGITDLLDLAVTRDASNDTFTVYTREQGSSVFTKEYETVDSGGDGIPWLDINNHTLLGFFGEDGNSDEAILSGKVFDLRFWHNVALTESQLNAFDPAPIAEEEETPAEPEELASTGANVAGAAFAAGALLLAGLATTVARRRRRGDAR